jgi:hypothetical protein
MWAGAVMIRKSLMILSLLGLVLSVALWAVSYLNILCYFPRQQHPEGHAHQYVVGVREGSLQVFYAEFSDVMPSLPAGCRSSGYSGLKTEWKPGVDFEANVCRVNLPLWIALLVSLIYPSYVLLPLTRRRKRKSLGLCVKCGYDLRGSIERCSECGSAIQSNERTPRRLVHVGIVIVLTALLAVLSASNQYGLVQPALLFVWAGAAVVGGVSKYRLLPTVLAALICSCGGAVGILVGIAIIDPAGADFGIALRVMIGLAAVPGVALATVCKLIQNVIARRTEDTRLTGQPSNSVREEGRGG